MINNIKNNKGFTLIEIIMVIIVLGVLSIFGFRFLSTSIHTYSMMEKRKGLFDQATMVMERISRELRDANSILAPTSDGNPYSTLSFTTSNATPQDSDTSISFQLSGTTLQRLGTATVNLADNVSTFTAARVTPTPDREEITIKLTLQEADAGEITLRSYICPKNLDYPPDPDDFSGRNFGGDWEEHYQ